METVLVHSASLFDATLVPTALPGLPLVAANWFDTLVDWFRDPTTLLIAMGPWVLLGVAIIVFIESGVLFPVLPGDSLLFAAGLLHTQLGINMWVMIGIILIAAFLGSQVGYFLGKRYGRGLFKDDARILKTEYVEQSEAFFARYGGRALVIGRFVPFVRTFVPLVAGIAKYPYRKFLAYSMTGALLWGAGVTWAGAALGGVPFVHENLEVIIVLIVIVSVIPMVVEIVLSKRRQKAEQKAGESAESAEQGAVEDEVTVEESSR
ncbi:DedA family protein [Actinomyces minihominis]|uniref:DedA family protein n=1 Tax=Actinomyces minihominis TaxID=2002838 RepID=UPI000C0825D4|nr:DedA family protein [Actinomyces minihominis]